MTDFVTLESLTRQSAARVLNFIEQAEPDQHDFNWWLGLAQAAVQETFRVAGQVNLEWAEVAARVYETLANRDQPSNAARDLMMLKARLITQMGNVELVPLASVDEIVQWFFDSLTMSLDDASTGDWQQRPVEEIRTLRNIKNDLGVIDLLKTHEKIKNHAELQKWLGIRAQLP